MRLVGATGVALVALGFYTASRPTIYEVSSFWTSSPTYFAIRLGVLTLALAGCYALSTIAVHRQAAGDALARLGQSSLFVYWIHVELVYGSLAAGLRHRLPLWQVAAAYLAFSGAMYAAVVLRDRLVAFWHTFAQVGRMPKSI
jgi:fucose 4-O-acetylase-like acetyltransferase